MRWKALAEIYTMHSFAPFLISIVVKIFELFANFAKLFVNFAEF